MPDAPDDLGGADLKGADQAGDDRIPGQAHDQIAGKVGTAFRTIGEIAQETGLPPHILRYWETRFPQLRPLQRAGNRRYYRPDDVALVRRIDTLLNQEGYTVRGVQQLLTRERRPPARVDTPIAALQAIRALLAQALEDDLAG